MGGDCAEALVPEVYGQGGAAAKLFGELLDFGGPLAHVARHVERVADNDFRDFVSADKAQEAAEVFAAGLAPHGEQGLCRVAEGIGECNADADLAYVQPP